MIKDILQTFSNKSMLPFVYNRIFVSAQVKTKNNRLDAKQCFFIGIYRKFIDDATAGKVPNDRYTKKESKHLVSYQISRSRMRQVFGCLSYNHETYDYRH